jgi:hypothetical protein
VITDSGGSTPQRADSDASQAIARWTGQLARTGSAVTSPPAMMVRKISFIRIEDIFLS